LIQVSSSSSINGVGRGNLFYSRVSRRQIGKTKGLLSRRAWTLQESLLSRRILRFTKDQVWWHCLEAEWTERDPRGCWKDTLWGRAFTPRVALGRKVERFKDGLHDLLLKWYSIVNDFSNRHITSRSGTFPAISGIAKEIHRLISQEYEAELWVGDIHRGLLWFRSGKRNINEYYAPSWTWASHVFETGDQT